MPNICAPSRENLLYTCYDDTELSHMFARIGAKMPSSREDAVAFLAEKYGGNPGDQLNWGDESMRVAFKPVATWAKNGWLSDGEINEVLNRYEEVYPTYANFGVELVDFWHYKKDALNYRKLSDLGNKIRYFSLVLNLYGYMKDAQIEHHWVTIFVDIKKKTIDFFDSSKYPSFSALEHLFFLLQLQLSLQYGGEFTVNVVNFPVQTGNGDCGIFAIDFVISRLRGETMDNYVGIYKKMTTHEQSEKMKKLRSKYFIV